ncbi:hypothetical protein HOE04_01620 [archaeon]|jgi:hypothetical protein|nr:hypothetical protein [archaeon]
MNSKEIVRKIEDFVCLKPRSIQEISEHIGKNWRTADRYVNEISENYGTISMRVFRGGTRGALKIVYWCGIDRAKGGVFQEQLEREIMNGRTKYDFSVFDIFQHVDSSSKEAWIKEGADESDAGRLVEFKDLLLQAEKQVLFFSGNLSFINLDDDVTNVFSVLEDLVREGVSIKVVCRVDIAGKRNVEKLLSLNHKYGKELIEIHHREQPLRVMIVDDKFFNMKEIKEPTLRLGELDIKTFIFYTICERDWVEWISRIFWKMFNGSVDVGVRVREMERIRV